jgi:probable rRNA maturation factor
MPIDLELQIATDTKTLPHPSQFRAWVSAVLSKEYETAELTIRIVDEPESRKLNKKYRQHDNPTNVLSFPFEKINSIDLSLLGDIIICAPIVEQEILKTQKPFLAHWAHLVVHGTLHLIGYDHKNIKEATIMEKYEIKILQNLGFCSPYGE